MKIKNLSIGFSEIPVLENFSLDVKNNSIVCITGPSGCGKTTLLNIIASLIKADDGLIDFEGQTQISYLFQEPRLLKDVNVLKNVSLTINNNKELAKSFLEKVGLGDCLRKYPAQLSGGQRQRVAIARAFAFPSEIILMDEPFQSLDVKMRNTLIGEFLSMWEENKKTVIWVTHDITEACLAADKIVCVSQKPMNIKATFNIKMARKNRTSENIALISAKIYSALTD